jgi:DNA-binding NtrC family response regulator
MANVILIGLDQTIAAELRRALGVGRHRVEERVRQVEAGDVMEVDIVFAGGKPSEYLSLLRQMREQRRALPFVVVTRSQEMTAWLDALEAGATDYCCSPFETGQIRSLMESALPETKSAGTLRS